MMLIRFIASIIAALLLIPMRIATQSKTLFAVISFGMAYMNYLDTGGGNLHDDDIYLTFLGIWGIFFVGFVLLSTFSSAIYQFFYNASQKKDKPLKQKPVKKEKAKKPPRPAKTPPPQNTQIKPCLTRIKGNPPTVKEAIQLLPADMQKLVTA